MEYNLEECFKFKINDEDDVKFINDRVEECSRQSLYREKFEKLEDIYFDIRLDIEEIESDYIIDLFERYDNTFSSISRDENCLAYYIGIQRVLKNNDRKNFIRKKIFDRDDINYIKRRIMPNILNDKEIVKIKEEIDNIYSTKIEKLFDRYNRILKRQALLENCLAYYIGIQTCLQIKKL